MNMSKTFAPAAVAVLLSLSFASCKPKQSAYHAAYERAQQRQIAQQAATQDAVRPMPAPVASQDASVREERVKPADGADENGLRAYSVVIGSFQNITNARSLRERMLGEGFPAILAQNEDGMYRVVVTSFDTKSEAVTSRERIKSRFAPLFSDAWILQRAY